MTPIEAYKEYSTKASCLAERGEIELAADRIEDAIVSFLASAFWQRKAAQIAEHEFVRLHKTWYDPSMAAARKLLKNIEAKLATLSELAAAIRDGRPHA